MRRLAAATALAALAATAAFEGPSSDACGGGGAGGGACEKRLVEKLQEPYASRPAVNFFLTEADEPYLACLDADPKFEHHRTFKESADIHWVDLLKRSPWRVATRAEARVIVVRAYPGWAARNPKCDNQFQEAMRRVRGAPEYRDGTPHLLLGTDWKSGKLMDKACPKCVKVRAGSSDKAKGVGHLAAPMVSHLHGYNQCSFTAAETQRLRAQGAEEFARRPREFYFGGQVDGRAAYRARAQCKRVFKEVGYEWQDTYGADKTPGVRSEFCANTASQKFGLHIRGDTPQSSRIYEIIDVGSVLVVMADGLIPNWVPGDHVPWKNFSLPIAEQISDAALAARLKAIAATPREEVERLRAALRSWTPSLLWDAPDAVVPEVILLDWAERANGPGHQTRI